MKSGQMSMVESFVIVHHHCRSFLECSYLVMSSDISSHVIMSSCYHVSSSHLISYPQIAEMEKNTIPSSTVKKTSSKAISRINDTTTTPTIYGPQTCPRLNVGK